MSCKLYLYFAGVIRIEVGRHIELLVLDDDLYPVLAHQAGGELAGERGVLVQSDGGGTALVIRACKDGFYYRRAFLSVFIIILFYL